MTDSSLNMRELPNKCKVIAIIAARSDSRRLPKKHLQTVQGKPMIYYLIERMKKTPLINDVVVATTDRTIDDELSCVSRSLGVQVFRGSLKDVVGRCAAAFKELDGEVAVKANGDNPLQSPEIIDIAVKQLLKTDIGLVTGKNKYTCLPVGLGSEVLSAKTIRWLDENTPTKYRDDLTKYVFIGKTPVKWSPVGSIPESWKLLDGSITVDSPDDLKRFAKVISMLEGDSPYDWKIGDIVNAIKKLKSRSTK